jgi:plasmid stability protein
MAKTIQIRNVPEELHRELRLRATAAGRSLSDYCLERLAQTGTRPTNAEVIKRAGDREGRVPRGVVAEIIREMRGD